MESGDFYKKEQDRWGQNADFYKSEIASPFFRKLLEKKVICYGKEPFDGKLVADIGSGNGFFLNYLRRRFDFYSVNIDFSLAMLASGKNVFGSSRKTYWVNGGAEQLPFKNESVETAVFNGALHHFKALRVLEPAVEETYRVLRPGGTVCIFDRNGSFSSHFFHSVALYGKKVLERFTGTLSSSSSDREPDFGDADLKFFFDRGFTLKRRLYASSVPFFIALVFCNAIEYTAGARVAAAVRHCAFPVAAIFENYLCFKAFSIEQCLLLEKTRSGEQ